MSINRSEANTLMKRCKAEVFDTEALNKCINEIDKEINEACINGLPSLFYDYSLYFRPIAKAYSKHLVEYYSGLQFNVTSNKEGLLISWV